jgi:adenylate cyclase
MVDLNHLGITDYIALPFRTGGLVHAARPFAESMRLPTSSAGMAVRQHNAATLATSAEQGFGADQLAEISRVLKIFGLHLERHIAMRVASNLVDTYIGPVAGAEVLHGTITRGDGERINAIIWASDLRDFTGLTERMAAEDVTAVLNAAFERLAGAVADHCGEVLKFIGDGLLAVFRFEDESTKRVAARAAMLAAEQALADLDAFNATPPSGLAGLAGWQPIRAGIALHEGEVFFGNVGAPDRLDFTVIGRAVNEASRVEGLTKLLGRRLLVTENVACHLDQPLDDLGMHALRGAGQAIRVYGVPGHGA